VIKYRDGDDLSWKVFDLPCPIESDCEGKSETPVPRPRSPKNTQMSLKDFTMTREIRRAVNGRAFIFEVVEASSGTKYALKQSFKPLQDTPSVLEDPEAEGELLKRIFELGGHPGVCSSISQFEDDSSFYSVQELATGGDLFDKIKSSGPFAEADAKSCFRQVVEGAFWLHSHGICHLDLSPENILLFPENTYKICDFGLARSNSFHLCLSNSGRIPGKIGYCAPEVYAKQAFRGDQADAFSLGVILFIILFGFPPYAVPHEDEDRRFQMIWKGKLRELLRMWKIRPPSRFALDLIESLLKPAHRRMALAEVLRHPWLL